MKTSAIKIAKPDIVKLFDASKQKIFLHSELSRLLGEQREFWRLPASFTTNAFIEFLLKSTKMKKVEFDFPYRKEVRYLWGEVPVYEILMSLKPAGYFSHYTAMYLNELTDQVPRTIYLNSEQAPPKVRTTELDQPAIKNAFERRQRSSKNIAPYLDYAICQISSMGVGNLGVVERDGPEGEKIRVTDLERTLIDIAVRPDYSGGVYEVLEAYRRAGGKASSNRLSALLSQMNFIYPYHQVIGFYLERSGAFKKSAIELFQLREIKYDFYLAHGMKETEYSERWRLFFPKGF